MKMDIEHYFKLLGLGRWQAVTAAKLHAAYAKTPTPRIITEAERRALQRAELRRRGEAFRKARGIKCAGAAPKKKAECWVIIDDPKLNYTKDEANE